MASQRFQHFAFQRRLRRRAFGKRPTAAVHCRAIQRCLQQQAIELSVVLHVGFALAALYLVERRLGNIDVPTLDKLRHLPEEEGEQQSADVAAIDIGVRVVAANAAHASDEILVIGDREVVNEPIAGSHFFQRDDGQGQQIAIQQFEAPVARGPKARQLCLHRGRACVVTPRRLQRCQIFAGGDADDPVRVTSDAVLPPNLANDTIRLILGKRRDDTERGQQIHDAAGDVVRRRAERHAFGRHGAVSQQIAAQERHAQLRGDIEDQVGDALGERGGAGEAEQLLPRQRCHPVDQTNLRARFTIAIFQRGLPEHPGKAVAHFTGKAPIPLANGQTDAGTVRHGTFGEEETENRQQVFVHCQLRSHFAVRVVFRRERVVFTRLKPGEIGFAKVRQADTGTHLVAA